MKSQSSSKKSISLAVGIAPGEVSHHLILLYQVRLWLVTRPEMFEMFCVWIGY